MSQIALPLELSGAAQTIVGGPSLDAVFAALQAGDGWPYRTAVLSGPARSGKSLLARWFATTLLAGRTTILITHDPLEACRISHNLAVLAGTPATLAPPITIQGAPPRDPRNLEVLKAQARLLQDLAA